MGDGLRKKVILERMIFYSKASSRDGEENRVVLNGNSGYFGLAMCLKYLENGYIQITGNNIDGERGWKLLSRFTLEPGRYTLTGMRNVLENTIALQLHISDDTGYYQYLYQHDEDVVFVVERTSEAILHVMVYPNAREINATIRPAVYKDE